MISELLPSGVQSGPVQFILCAVIALAAAAPIGAISILTIQRALSAGFWRAFWPTLGAVTANGIFGIIAALGTGYLTAAIMGGKLWLRLAGSVILVLVGIRLFTHRHTEGSVKKDGFEPLQLAFLYLTLALSNPLTLGFYLASFAMLGLKSDHLLALQSLTMSGGIVFGATTWFAIICLAAGRFHMNLSGEVLGRIRRSVGIILILLAVFNVISFLVKG